MTESSLTAFGAACREIRTLRNYKMVDQARAFECSPSFISLVECGAKQPPEGYVEKFGRWLQLDNVTQKHLQLLADARLNVIPFLPSNKERAAAARRLFRRINKMSPEEIRHLHRALDKDFK